VETVEGLGTRICMTVNGREQRFVVGHDLTGSETLAEVLRERLGLVGLKIACDQGACGACTVIMDGKAVLSCMTLAVEADGHDILTIEGLPDDDPVVRAFACQCEPGHGTALQCGFCTPGAVMTARAFLNENPDPTLDEVREALAGNLCRCGCYQGIAQAVLAAAAEMRRAAAVPAAEATEADPHVDGIAGAPGRSPRDERGEA
jgi:carbon-monoxide dehydrogenase small subunit